MAPNDIHLADLVLTRTVRAPRQQVYAAFIEPDAIAGWFGPVGFHVPRASVQIEPVVGGVHRLTMVSDLDRQLRSSVDSRFLDIVPGRRIVSQEDLGDGLEPMTLDVLFEDVLGGTFVTLEQGPYAEGIVPMAARGWESSLHKLDSYLAGLRLDVA